MSKNKRYSHGKLRGLKITINLDLCFETAPEKIETLPSESSNNVEWPQNSGLVLPSATLHFVGWVEPGLVKILQSGLLTFSSFLFLFLGVRFRVSVFRICYCVYLA